MTISSAALRPGIAQGLYPQRPETTLGWVERALTQIAAVHKQHSNLSSSRYRRAVKRVNRDGQPLNDLGQEALVAKGQEIRALLRTQGLREELVIRAFALIREMAQRTVGMRHFDVQLVGGFVMLDGMLAEMHTGEGKTLTATLPACTAALAGIPVHVITVNDYLVTRDADWMRPLYNAFGLTVGTITSGMEPDARREAYACDITYCTNKELVFDYLKDRLVLKQSGGRLHMKFESLYREKPRSARLLLRGLCFAIVDEADSVLVDEARTPLIISRGSDTSAQQSLYTHALDIARQLQKGLDFSLREREREIELSEHGQSRIDELTVSLGGLWTGRQRRQEFVRQALNALHLFELDKHYLVAEGKVQIIDEYTGRLMPDRSWEHGLHQMIETKEGCEVTGQHETQARISYQRFFRRYLRLAGMTGTAKEIAGELWAVYRLNVVTVPPNRRVKRKALPGRVYRSADSKWSAIVKRVATLHTRGRPVLIGTRSVGASEHLSELLYEADLPHQVLNARQDQDEAKVIEQAGQIARITVATNMAGRGTDIRLEKGVAAIGGLHVIASERHDATRIDRQLFGRCARQGEPGSFEYIVSLEDELIRNHFPWLSGLVARTGPRRRPLPLWLAAPMTTIPQAAAERRHGRARRQLLKSDKRMGDLLAFSGRPE